MPVQFSSAEVLPEVFVKQGRRNVDGGGMGRGGNFFFVTPGGA